MAKKTKIVDGVTFLPWGSKNGRQVYVQEGPVAKQMNLLEQKVNRCFHHRTLYNKIKSLKDTTSNYSSLSKTAMSNRRNCRMNLAGSELEYFLKDGDAHITRLVIQSKSSQDARLRNAGVGLYSVRRDEESNWQIDSPTDKIKTLHASVNGEVETLAEVLQFIPKMIELGNSMGLAEITGKGERKGFTHFYTPSKNGKDNGWQEMAATMVGKKGVKKKDVRAAQIENLASCIELAKNKKVHWTVQGSGSEIFCEALSVVAKRNKGLDLSKQTAHFFNPHTNPTKIQEVMQQFDAAESDKGLYNSNFKSPGNIKAMAQGNKNYYKNKIAESKAEDPKKDVANLVKESKRSASTVHSINGMATFITGVGVSAYSGWSFFNNPELVTAATEMAAGLYEGVINNPVGAGAGAIITALALHKKIFHTTPKMIAMTKLTAASIIKDRRLDQVTEKSPINAASQLKNLRMGMSI